MPSYGLGMIAGCTGLVASFRGLRAAKETSAAIFFKKYKLVSILATFAAIVAMAGVLWLGIVFSVHSVCLVKVEDPVHYDSVILNQTCYNFVDDWTKENDTLPDNKEEDKLIEFMFFNEANMFSGEGSGSGEPDDGISVEGSGQTDGIFEDRFERPALAKSYFFTLMTEIVLLVVDFIFLIALAQSAGCCFCCEDNSIQPMETESSQRSSYLVSDNDESSDSEESDSESETDA